MKKSNIAFRAAFAVSSFCMVSMAAVLYAGTPEMSGGGFISLSPWVDCIIWAIPMVIGWCVMVFCAAVDRQTLSVPQQWRFPAAYFLNLVILTAVVLLMGLCGFLDKFSGRHLQFYGYVAFLVIAYVVTGFLWGRFYGGDVKTALLSCGILLAVLGVLAAFRLAAIAAEMEYWGPNVIYGYTDWVMDSWQGQAIAWLDLPACVIMDNYNYAYYEALGGCHSIPREVMTWLVCLCPPVVFTLSWLAGRKLKK